MSPEPIPVMIPKPRSAADMARRIAERAAVHREKQLVEAVVRGGRWAASYHELGDAFTGTRADILCMECLAGGKETVLRVEPVTGPRDLGFCFTVPPAWARYVHVIRAAQMAEWMDEPEAPKAPAKDPETPPKDQKGKKEDARG